VNDCRRWRAGGQGSRVRRRSAAGSVTGGEYSSAGSMLQTVRMPIEPAISSENRPRYGPLPRRPASRSLAASAMAGNRCMAANKTTPAISSDKTMLLCWLDGHMSILAM
jgi:hypothetical protein